MQFTSVEGSAFVIFRLIQISNWMFASEIEDNSKRLWTVWLSSNSFPGYGAFYYFLQQMSSLSTLHLTSQTH